MAELERLLPNLFLTFLDEYRTLVETNFPTLYKNFELYKELPLGALIAIEADDFGVPPLTRALVPIRILEYKVDKSGSNEARLTGVNEINEETARWRTDSNSRGLRHTSTLELLQPLQNYMPIKGINNRLGLLRNLVYRAVQEDAKSAFRRLMTQAKS